MASPTNPIESEVLDRYARGAECVEPALCCPTGDYEREYLKILPREIVEKDYGCGNPSKWADVGDAVVDLGSGAGKACYILSQKVGPTGRVIGVDFNDAMLAVAEKYRLGMARKIGYANVSFVKGRIQELSRVVEPETIDLVVSNCVLNLVRPDDKERLFAEIFTVLKPGGRAVISDIVCDRKPTPAIMADPKLWSGCISGAFREDIFPRMFVDAGFPSVEVLERQSEPWRTIDGIEFRSITIRALKTIPEPDADPTSTCCAPARG